MKSNICAVYKGKEYSAGFMADGSIILRSNDEKDVENGFQIHKGANPNVKCIKYVLRSEIEQIFKKVVVAMYHGYDFWVVQEEMGNILISATNMNYHICDQLEMKCVDKGI